MLATYFAVIERALLAGMNVKTPFAIYRSSIRGVFDSQQDRFDPARHRVLPRIRPGRRLYRVFRERARVARQRVVTPSPQPLTFVDVTTGAEDSLLTPGGPGKVLGHDLAFDAADPNQGVFFVAGDRSETRAELLIEEQGSKLVFVVPPLAAGDYTLEVRSTCNGAEKVRSGVLESPLTVVP